MQHFVVICHDLDIVVRGGIYFYVLSLVFLFNLLIHLTTWACLIDAGVGSGLLVEY